MTRRKEILEQLQRQDMTAEELARLFDADVKDILIDLGHVSKTAKGQKKKFIIAPAQCLSCGFVFKKRTKMSTPTKCPQCKAERISHPRFSVV